MEWFEWFRFFGSDSSTGEGVFCSIKHCLKGMARVPFRFLRTVAIVPVPTSVPVKTVPMVLVWRRADCGFGEYGVNFRRQVAVSGKRKTYTRTSPPLYLKRPCNGEGENNGRYQ